MYSYYTIQGWRTLVIWRFGRMSFSLCMSICLSISNFGIFYKILQTKLKVYLWFNHAWITSHYPEGRTGSNCTILRVLYTWFLTGCIFSSKHVLLSMIIGISRKEATYTKSINVLRMIRKAISYDVYHTPSMPSTSQQLVASPQRRCPDRVLYNDFAD